MESQTNSTETESSSEVAETADVASQNVNTTQKKEQVVEAPRKFKLKVNGKQLELDEKAAVAYAQKGMAADERFQKAALREKQIDALLKKAKEDPDSFMREVFGQDSVEFSKKRLAKELEELSLDPKQKELREYKRKVEAYEAEKAKAKQLEARQSQERAVQKWTQHYDKVLPEAIKSAGLPLTKEVIKTATEIMIANLEDKIDLPMQAIMELTKERYVESVKGFLSNSDAEKLTALLGSDLASKLGVATKNSKKSTVKQAVQTEQREISTKSQRQREKQLQDRIAQWASE